MGACISSHSSNSAHGLPTQIPSMSSSSSSSSFSSWTKNRREEKKRRTKGNEAKGNDGGPSDRRPAISAVSGRGCVLAEEELHRLPGRLYLNGASEVACLYSQQGKKGTNQDAMLVWENFASRNDTIFCGVFDGHGPFGHMVARKVRDSLPVKLCTQWTGNASDNNSPHEIGLGPGSRDSEEMATSFDDEWGKSEDVDLNGKPPEIYVTLRQSFLKAFKLMDKELKLHPSIDCFCSGSTAVTVIKQGQDLVIGNVGDSRAILGTRDKDNNLVALQLTVDLKPNLPREAARIQQCNGRVFALHDEPEVARVWLPNNDSPGLAMARAFGDFCLKDYGLISVPDVFYRRLTEKDEFIVLATDGVWDALSNKEVVDIVSSAPTRGTAARALVDCAVRSWRLKFPTSKIDDCAAVCLFLEPPASSYQAPEHDSYESPKEPAEHLSVDSSLMHQNKSIKEEVDDPNSMHQNKSMKEKTDESVSYETHTSIHSYTVLDSDEIVPVPEPRQDKLPERSKSTRSLADCISTSEEEEWSALEGITRVNSLLSLPRFLSSDKRSTRRKWLR